MSARQQVVTEEWVTFPGGELEGQRPKALCEACLAVGEAGISCRGACEGHVRRRAPTAGAPKTSAPEPAINPPTGITRNESCSTLAIEPRICSGARSCRTDVFVVV